MPIIKITGSCFLGYELKLIGKSGGTISFKGKTKKDVIEMVKNTIKNNRVMIDGEIVNYNSINTKAD